MSLYIFFKLKEHLKQVYFNIHLCLNLVIYNLMLIFYKGQTQLATCLLFPPFLSLIAGMMPGGTAAIF